jgi:hypothetical protein
VSWALGRFLPIRDSDSADKIDTNMLFAVPAAFVCLLGSVDAASEKYTTSGDSLPFIRTAGLGDPFFYDDFNRARIFHGFVP